MSLENNIKRIADVLESIANNLATSQEASDLGLGAPAPPLAPAPPAAAPAPVTPKLQMTPKFARR